MPVGQVFVGSKVFEEPVVFDNTVTFTTRGTQTVNGTSSQWQYSYLEPANTLASTIDGRMSASASSAALTSGTVYVNAIPMNAGITVRNVSLFVAGTAEATGTHAWVGIANSAGVVLAVSADNTGAAYFGGTNTAVTTALAAALTTSYQGLYYVFVNVTATTTPVFAAAPAFVNSALSNVAPIVCGTTLTSQTTPVAVGSSLSTVTATAGHQFYAWLT